MNFDFAEMSAKNKRVAVVAASFPPYGWGGVETSHYNLLRAFRERGHVVKGFTYCDCRASEENDGIIRRGLPEIICRLIRTLIFVCLRISGERGVVYQCADTVIGALGALLLVWEIWRFAPDVIIVPDCCAPNAFWPMFCSRTILIAHHNPLRFLDNPLLGEHSQRDASLALCLEKLAMNKADVVVCPSRYMRDVFIQTHSFPGPIEVVPNLIDSTLLANTPVFNLREHRGIAAETPIVYIPSAGSIYKGSGFVFEIIRRVAGEYGDEIGFYLTGRLEPDLLKCLECIPANAKLIAPGNVPYLENIANIKSCTLCITPTLVENFGMSILEAQFCGLPVVTFDVGGNADIVIHGETGYLVDFLDVESIVRLSLNLLREPQLLDDMRKIAAFEAKGRFAEQVVLERLLRLF